MSLKINNKSKLMPILLKKDPGFRFYPKQAAECGNFVHVVLELESIRKIEKRHCGIILWA